MGLILDLLTNVTALRATTGDKLNHLWVDIGNKSNLTTTNKTSLVNAINEVHGKNLQDVLYKGNTADNIQIKLNAVGGASANYHATYRPTGTGGWARSGFVHSILNSEGEVVKEFQIGSFSSGYTYVTVGSYNTGTALRWYDTDPVGTIRINNRVIPTRINGLLADNNGNIDIPTQIQNLGYGANSGGITISEGTGVTLRDLFLTQRQDANARTLGMSFIPYYTSAGSVNYSTGGISTGLRVERYSTATSQSGFDINRAATQDFIRYKTFDSLDTESPWKIIADRDWADSRFALKTEIPGNYITTNTTQTGLSGNKTTSGALIFNGTQATSLFVQRTGTPSNSNIGFGFDNVNSFYIGARNSSIFSISTAANMTDSSDLLKVDVSGTISAKGGIGGNNLISRDSGGFTIDTTTSGNRAEMILRHRWSANNHTFTIGGVGQGAGSMQSWGMYKFKNDRTTNGNDGFFGWMGDSDILRATSLSGIGTRMVVADNGGNLSTQELPTNPTNYVTKNNDATTTLSTTVLDLNVSSSGASILYVGASSTNIPTGISGTAGGLLITGTHASVGQYQLYVARGENDAFLYRNQSGNWNRSASRDWTNSQGFLKDNSLTNYYTKTESNNQFVNLTAVQTIGGTKTFSLSPVVPNGTLASHAVNKGQLDAIPKHTEISEVNINNQSSAVLGLISGRRFRKGLEDWAIEKGINNGILTYSANGGIQTVDWNSFANGDKSIAIGYVTSNSGFGEVVIGTQLVTKGVANFLSGFTISNDSVYSTLTGSYLQNKGDRSVLNGTGLVNYQEGHVVLGNYNKYEKTNHTIDGSVPLSTVRLFTIGNGQSDITTSNAFEMYRDGSAELSGLFRYKTNVSLPANIADEVIPNAGWIRNNTGGGGGGTDFSYKTVPADYLVTDADHAVILVPTSANITITFPDTLKEAIYVRVDNASNGEVNIVAPNATGDLVGTTPFKLVANGEMVYYRVNASMRRIKGDFIF